MVALSTPGEVSRQGLGRGDYLVVWKKNFVFPFAQVPGMEVRLATDSAVERGTETLYALQ